MKGSYYFRVKSKKALFEFSIKRNITVIKGDSASEFGVITVRRNRKDFE